MAKVSGIVLVLKDIGQGHHDSARCTIIQKCFFFQRRRSLRGSSHGRGRVPDVVRFLFPVVRCLSSDVRFPAPNHLRGRRNGMRMATAIDIIIAFIYWNFEFCFPLSVVRCPMSRGCTSGRDGRCGRDVSRPYCFILSAVR